MLATPKDLFHLWECFCWCICKLPISRSASLRHCTRPGIWNVSSFRFRPDTIAEQLQQQRKMLPVIRMMTAMMMVESPLVYPPPVRHCPNCKRVFIMRLQSDGCYTLVGPREKPAVPLLAPPPHSAHVCVCVCAIQCSDKLLEVATNLQLVVSQQQQRQNSTKRSSCCWENQQKTKEKRQRKWCFAGWSRGEGGVWWGFSFWREHKVEFSGIAWPAFSAPCRALWLHLMTLIKLPTDDNLSLALDSGHRLLNPNRISRSGSKTSGSGTGRSGRNSRIWL